MEDWKHCPQFAPLADLIRSHGSFAVIAHVHPDGDAIGSTLALGEALKQMGKKVVMMNEDGVPSNLAFMPGVENIIPTPDEPVCPSDCSWAAATMHGWVTGSPSEIRDLM